jgi:hypothetical protein
MLLCGPDSVPSSAHAHMLRAIRRHCADFSLLLDTCIGRAGYVRDPETQMADKAAGGTELTKVRRGCTQPGRGLTACPAQMLRASILVISTKDN